MSLSWPEHLLTIDEWEAFAEKDDRRLELVEGVLQVSPRPLPFHTKISMRLGVTLDEQLPPHLTALVEARVVLGGDPPTGRIPDVAVVPTAEYERNPPRFAAASLSLAVEILSDGTRRTDRVTKFSEYAEAGIPLYWIIDPAEPVTLTAHTLVDGFYEVTGEYRGGAELDVAGHRVVVDLTKLIPR